MNSLEEKNKVEIINLLDAIFLSMFILGTLTLIGYEYILHEKPHTIIFYLSVTSFGLFLVLSLVKYYLAPIKKLDLEFFRNIIFVM